VERPVRRADKRKTLYVIINEIGRKWGQGCDEDYLAGHWLASRERYTGNGPGAPFGPPRRPTRY